MRIILILSVCMICVGFTDSYIVLSPQTQQFMAGATESPMNAVEGGLPEAKTSLWNNTAAWIWLTQQKFHDALTGELQALQATTSTGWMLILLSFLYGVFHAAGPGHGKAILTTYLLTHKQQLHRGVAMGITAALLQGLTALILVYGLTGLAGWVPGDTETATLWTIRISLILLTILGVYIFQRALLHLITLLRNPRANKKIGSHNHHAHDHDHTHLHAENCGCKHVPDATQISASKNTKAVASAVLAIGLRPCNGAILVLILARIMDLAWYGAGSVLAMSLGTAITVITLAALTVKARDWAAALVAHRSPLWLLAGGSLGVLGGLLLLFLGISSLVFSFTSKLVLV